VTAGGNHEHGERRLGVRWQSPIGAVRLDMARPLDATQRFRLHPRLGPNL